MKVLVIIPTYNEIDNIPRMIDAIFSLGEEYSLLIVDDNSPDGTGEYVKKRLENESRLHLVVNEKKGGIGPAYIRGFKEALGFETDYIVQMDCDFSHNPKSVPSLIEAAQNGADFVIGSRYIKGISVINWPLRRLLLSYFANMYVRFVLGMKIQDTTGGFKLFRKSVLEDMNFDNVRSAGYSFQIEINYVLEKHGYKAAEVPIIFGERESGESKMSGNIIKEALFRVLRLKFIDVKKYFKS